MLSRPLQRFSIIFLVAVAVHAQQANTPGTSTSTHSSKAAASSTASSKSGTHDLGSVSNGVYRNSFFGITYKLRFGWVERTHDMQEGDDPGKSMVLLAAFERPPEARGDTVNSAVVIAAEKASSFSGLKSAADYFGPITELATAKGFKVVNQPYDFTVGTKPVVRGDYQKERGSVTMHQASLVALEKGYVVSFTFIAGGDDEMQELLENLRFSASSPGKPKSVD